MFDQLHGCRADGATATTNDDLISLISVMRSESDYFFWIGGEQFDEC
ncbi:MAG: hypothetical protein H0X47_08585 [Nitrospirales bacterium]|nr:hypothetical protein [Nitrospirales bacterium]